MRGGGSFDQSNMARVIFSGWEEWLIHMCQMRRRLVWYDLFTYKVRWRVWTSFGPHTNESCHITHMTCLSASQMTCVNLIWPTYDVCDMTCLRGILIWPTYEWVMPYHTYDFLSASQMTWSDKSTCVNLFWPTYDVCDMTCLRGILIWPTYEWVMAHVWMSHAISHIWLVCVISHIWLVWRVHMWAKWVMPHIWMK